MAGRFSPKRAAFALIAVCLVLGTTMALDRALGLVAPLPAPGQGLLFEPYSRVLYETPEFTCLVSINALGFRGGAFPVDRTAGVPRVLAIGDSFTYGWGVAVEEAWPAVLEGRLREWVPGVEVANLGRPGGEPGSYAAVAERAIPLLRPDLVVVAVLQEDDLLACVEGAGAGQAAQSGRAVSAVRRADVRSAILPIVSWVVPRLYPNLTRRMLARRTNRASEQWQVMAAAIQVRFDEAQRRRFARLDPTIRHRFMAGQLNPAVILHAMTDPLAYTRHLDIDAAETRAAIGRMAEQFARLKAVADASGARVLVVPVPAGAYVNRLSYHGHTRLGYKLRPNLLETDAMDRAIQVAADMAGLPFLTVTAPFRARADEPLYFPLDGHFNAAGHALFAEHLAPGVAPLLVDAGTRVSPRTAP